MDNFTMSENSGSFGMQQRQDRFDAIGDLIVGPPGPPGPAGPPGADGTVSFDELTPAQRESLRGEGVPAGGTTGQVLAKASNVDYETEWVDQSGGSASMTILSYGHSTWADFIAAYNAKSIVYCRASITAANPGAGSQVRMAAMAYVNHPTVPTSVDFVYYYPATHSDSQQGDQLFVYTLSQTNGWSYVAKNTFSKIVAGENMTSSYANGTLTLNATGGGGGTSDYDALSNRPSINNVTLSGNKTAAQLGLGTYSKPSGGIPASDLASAVQSKLDNTVVVSDTQPTATENKLWVDTDAGAGASYQIPTVAEMEAADAQVAAEIGIVITGKRPSMAVTAGQYVIVRNSTINGITDGLYTANAALSPSADVTAANLAAVNNGGLNSLQNNVFQYAEYTLTKLSTATNWTIIRYHACKLGKIAFLQIVASVTAAQDSSGVRIFALPQDLRPRYGIETRVTSAEFAMDVNVNITVEGNMAFTRGGSTAGNIRMDFCYPTN